MRWLIKAQAIANFGYIPVGVLQQSAGFGYHAIKN